MFKKLQKQVMAILVMGSMIFGIVMPAAADEIYGRAQSGVEMMQKKRIITANITASSGSSTIAVDADGVVYTHSFEINDADYFALGYKIAGSNTTVKIELEQGIAVPSTEGAADSTWVVPSGISAVESGLANNSAQHFKALSPLPLPYGRLKITGTAGSDTTMTATLSTQNSL